MSGFDKIPGFFKPQFQNFSPSPAAQRRVEPNPFETANAFPNSPFSNFASTMGQSDPGGIDIEAVLRDLEQMAKMMDAPKRLPGTGIDRLS